MRQIPLAIGPTAAPSVDNFLPGPNAAALLEISALAARTAAGAAATMPVYLWGPAGSGKTHLLRALTQRCQFAGLAVGWFDAADPQPWFWMADWSLVVIDRCDVLCADTQQAAFALFVEAAAQGTQVAAAGRLPPVDLPLRDDLRTRLAWGQVHALQPLGEADTRAVLRRQADHRGILLPDDVLSYLLNRFQRDLSHLMRMLDALDDFALVRSRHITVPLVRAMLAEQGLDEAVAR
jgi:DnaA family protein